MQRATNVLFVSLSSFSSHLDRIRVRVSVRRGKNGGNPDVTCFTRRQSLLLLPASFVPIVVVLPRNIEESAISAFASLPTSRIPTFFQPHSFLAPYFSSSILHTVNVKTFNRLRKKRVYIRKYERTRAFLDLVSRFCNSDSFGSRVILSLKIYPPCRMARFVPCSTGCFERIRNERREINILRLKLIYAKKVYILHISTVLYF